MRGWQCARHRWLAVLAAAAIPIVLVSVVAAQNGEESDAESPWNYIPVHGETPDHSAMLTDPFTTAQEVTATCLICHPAVAASLLTTSHWTWISGTRIGPDGTELPYGKLNAINNFCISVVSNWGRCAECHISYGWDSADFDFTNSENIDCLVCHDTTGTYHKSKTDAGYPEADVDLLAVAQSVGRPGRQACGSCHFYGGGGDAVKHGDMSSTLADPSEDIDVHMGRFDLLCQDCHRTEDHQISGRLPMLSNDLGADVRCESCHGEAPHSIFRINAHCRSVACQSCHIPSFAPEVPTRLEWDWSTAGLTEAADEREWDRKKGSFVSGTDVVPEYRWWNGEMAVYLPGQ
jgi:octaheme c-type cytochrome (tetrathionate reductase family)